MAQSRHRGTAIAMAMPVTHRVLIIKGNKPNLPFKGNHSVENSKSYRLSVSSIGSDLYTNPMAIRNRTIMLNQVKYFITWRPIVSVNILLLKLMLLNGNGF